MRRAERFVGAVVASALLGCGIGGAKSAPLSPLASVPSISREVAAQIAGVAPALPHDPSPAMPPPASVAPATMNLVKDPLVEQILATGGPTLKTVLASPEKYRFQVLYGAISAGSAPVLERRGYRADVEYFYPASSMKMPITLALMERLAVQRKTKPGLTRDATLKIHPVTGTADPYVTSLSRELWRALIVSDNFSANRLLGFVGHREVHEELWSLGLASARIHAGFATGADIDPAESSPRIEITLPGGGADELPARHSDLKLPPTEAAGLDVGKANIVNGQRIEAPLSFADKNAMHLRELQDTLVRIMRPELLPAGAVGSDTIAKEDLDYVREALGTFPSASGLAGFDRNVVADYPLSPLLRGIERVRARGHFQIFTKVGQAYGFLIANAYVVDKDTGRAFFLIASIYANPDETMNNDNYAYDAISFPALADVGEAFCRHAFAP